MRNLLAFFVFCVSTATAQAFCGLYVAPSDANLTPKTARVVMVRDGARTVLTLTSEAPEGAPKDFALVVPVPAVLEMKQINIGSLDVVDRVDAVSAPRLVEYFDPDPCTPPESSPSKAPDSSAGKAVGVSVAASYEVGEYDVVILDAKQNANLVAWLKANKYKVPKAAAPILASYVKRQLKFVVAKVNLARQAQTGLPYLRPLQLAYESGRFDLPLRFGAAGGPQDLLLFALTKEGRVESTNYRTVKVPSGVELPEYTKAELAPFYKSMIDRQVKKDDQSAIYLEYAWDAGWCDPCAAPPLTPAELKKLGVFWSVVNKGDAFLTRLHLRYDAKTFAEDPLFKVTADRNNFQARFVVRTPFKGEASCPAATTYRAALARRQELEAQKLAVLTGWDIAAIRRKASLKTPPVESKGDKAWVDDLWKN